MITFLICGIALGWVWGYMSGMDRGWNDAIKIARAWEGISRDWRCAYLMETADTDHEREAIKEVRELDRMYDGVQIG